MARCPLCESDVPDGRTTCDACGQPFNRRLTARAAPDLVKRAIDAARKDLAASTRDPADATFARSLVDRAEQTEAAGELGRALDLARASRRALEIAKRKTRVTEALRHADAVLERAKKAGIETLAFQRNIEGARALAARGNLEAAERLLRRVSVRTLDQRRERVLQGILDKAASRVRYSKERGGSVDDAESHVREAREALAHREYNKIRPLAAKAIERADSQRKYARAETILDRAAADVEAARRDGVNIAEARRVLTQARDALRRGVYADIPLLAQRARHSLREARRHAGADFVFRESAREAARERRKGADVGRAEGILAQAAEALAGKDYLKVRALAKDAHDAVREASVLRNVRDAFASLQVDAEDLRKLGADAADFETTLVELTKAVEGNDLPSARRLVSRARHASESARDAHFRSIMERSLQIILANAARGLDPVVARQLLKEVDDAISLGKPVDMQSLIDTRMAEADAETESRLNSRVMQTRDDIVALRQAGQTDTAGLEGKLADAAIAIQERRLMHADMLLDSVEHDVFATRELLRSAAAEVLGQARGEVARAKADGIAVETADRMLKDAETSYSEARYGDTIYAGKACISEVEELARSAADTKRNSDVEQARSRAERADEIRGRMAAVRGEIGDLVAQNVDLARAEETLSAAEQAISRGSLEEAERLVAAAEGMVQGAKVTLNGQAQAALRRARKAVEVAAGDGIEAPEFAALLERAQGALNGGRPVEVLAAIGEIDRILAEKRQGRFQEDQRRALDKARSAASKFITVKKLIEDLRQADIDITGAEESLQAAENALRERNFDDVDAILSDLDATAKELMDELVAAAKNLIDRAERKIRDGRDKKLPMEDAVALLDTAEGNFARGEYADAVEHARAADQKVSEALKTLSEREADARRKAQESARVIVSDLRKTMGDLARADISISGAEHALARAEAAADAGRYADVPRELAETKDMAARLTAGLEAAAKDLVAYAEREVNDVRSSGLDPGRAETVLANARDAIEDHRFVEAIEYKKVIEDILEQSRRERETRKARDGLSELRAKLEAHAKLGADVRMASEFLARAEAMIDAGELQDVSGYAKRVDEEVDLARRGHLSSVVTSFSPMIEEGVSLGLHEQDLEEYRTHAAEAAAADDLEEVYRLKGDLQERLLEAKRTQIVKRSMSEIEGLEDLVSQSERLGIPAESARAHLERARNAIVGGDIDGFEHGLADARAALEDSRRTQFLEKYETRVHAISTMIANAKRLGAEVGDAEGSLGKAEAALRASDMAMADILIKQAEVSIGIQIQNFIKNRYPNLALRLPAAGLQAGEWNQYAFEVENRGKLPARNVQIELSGEVEAKGVAPIPEIGVGEVVPVRVGVKPKAAGAVPVAVGITYKRLFDENRYEVRDTKEIKVEPEATYLVEDVFLIHSDGRLIAHHSRKFREEIDEDIFSGMLTVVQDFVKDSFKSRTRVGMKRLDFGDSKILIERSPHTFLATVLVGQEPKLLPLYMLQVLKEVEDRYGTVLEKWTGLLHQLDGIDGSIQKLLFLAKDPTADVGAFADSPVTLTAKVIEALGAAQTTEANELLAKAQSTLETDIQLAWQFIEQARTQADQIQHQLRDRMGDILAAARDTVAEMKSIGADTSQAELLLKEAEEAFQEGKYERVREIQQGLHESLERQKGELASKKVEVELASLINDIQIAKSQNLDVREAESYLTKIEGAIQKKNARQMDEYLRRAKETLARQRRRTVLDRARANVEKLRATVAQAKAVHADVGDVEGLLQKAEDAMRSEDLKGIEPLIDRAEAAMKARVDQLLKDRYPRLFLETAHAGLQTNRWNRFEMQITNKGNWPAERVTPIVTGPVEVQGLKVIDIIEPNQKVSLEFGLKPKEAGTMDFDFEVQYSRPLDEGKHQTTDTAVVRVEAEGGYIVDDALLFHSTGALVCRESRIYLPPEEASRIAGLETKVKDFVNKAFPSGGKSLQTISFGGTSVLAARGPQAFLAVTLRGKEPAILALYLFQVLKEIHDSYGPRLEAWSGDPAELPGIRDLVRKVLFATDVEGVSLGPLEDTAVSKIPMLMERGLLAGEGDKDFMVWARSSIEKGGYNQGVAVLKSVADATMGPTEEIAKQIRQTIIASKEAGTLQISDEQVNAYVEFLRLALEAAFQAKHRAGIERYWPVSRIAVKTADQLGYDALSAFRKVIVGQSGAKELDLVAPNEVWRGMKIDVQVHMDSVSASYKLWARKIEILLRSQDAWKIKAGLDRGEYAVGIEGQKVRIDPTMVSFVESVPDYVVEEPFEGGVVYLDTRMSKELIAEGYAKEIVNLVLEARKDMRIEDDRIVEIELVAGKGFRAMVSPWKDMILRDANALDMQFVTSPASESYVIEAGLGQETFLLGVRRAEM
jgi:Domain of unknown function (DUF5915)